MSYTNWVSLIVGLVALGGVIFGAFYKTWQDKKNIKMQARIQWIQEVRNHTAELLSRGYADKNTGYYFKKEIETVCLFFTTNESETSAIPNSENTPKPSNNTSSNSAPSSAPSDSSSKSE